MTQERFNTYPGTKDDISVARIENTSLHISDVVDVGAFGRDGTVRVRFNDVGGPHLSEPTIMRLRVRESTRPFHPQATKFKDEQ